MRIAMLSWRDPSHPAAGGAESYTHSLLQELSRRGHELTWFAAEVPGLPSYQEMENYTLIRSGSRFSVYSHGRSWAKENQDVFDVFVDQVNTVPFQLAQLLPDARTFGLFYQTAEDVWGYNVPWPASSIGRRFLEPRWISSFRTSPVFALSKSTADALANFGVNRTTVLGGALSEMPPIDPSITRSEAPSAIVVSRLVGYKRVDHAVTSVFEARKQIPDLTLHVVGDGPLRTSLQRGAPPWVTFHGGVSEERKSHLMSKAWFHLACSVREGWGLTVTEAAVLGVPTLAYATPGLIDSVTAADGYLAEEDPVILGRKLAELIQTRAHLSYRPPPLGGASSWTQIADRFESTLERCSQ